MSGLLGGLGLYLAVAIVLVLVVGSVGPYDRSAFPSREAMVMQAVLSILLIGVLVGVPLAGLWLLAATADGLVWLVGRLRRVSLPWLVGRLRRVSLPWLLCWLWRTWSGTRCAEHQIRMTDG